MPWLTQLLDVARRTGHPVTEVAGWKTRGHGPQPEVRGIVCHHTAGPRAGGDYPSLSVVRNGRPGLPGPLSHYGLGRSGRIYVIAAGRCWHNAPSTSPLHDNSSSIGIEAENSGSQPWPDVQVDAYIKLCAELCRAFGLPVARVKAHREVNRGKPDPAGIDMKQFRDSVAAVLANPRPAPTTWTEEIVKELPILRPKAGGYDVKTIRGLLFVRGVLAPARYGGQVGLKSWLERTEYDADLAADVRTFKRGEDLPDNATVDADTWAALLRVS